ncbi:hypothetical protein C8R46DRAFT_883890 [Mycena filopes]|nr:hypothetical protein C8R46DRAFT_883890 [Mycena filopes]
MSSTDSEAQRPPKHRRDDSNSESANPAPLTRSKIWMGYGDVVLQAESTLFKVNRDILVKHSNVFQGLFLVPQPQNQEVVEGCPIVKLSDMAKDVGLLLDALYDPLHQKVKQPFEVVAMMLRLGRKYEIAILEDDAIARMHTEFPTTVHEWELRIIKKGLGTIHEYPGVYVDLLNLAYDEGVFTCIPMLAVKCVELYSLLFAGVERADGSRVKLPDSTKITLALGKERVCQLHERYKREIEEYVAPKCGRRDCAGIKSCVTPSRLEGCSLNSLVFAIWPMVATSCGKCNKAITSHWDRIREAAWKELPGIFGLSGWNELKDSD